MCIYVCKGIYIYIYITFFLWVDKSYFPRMVVSILVFILLRSMNMSVYTIFNMCMYVNMQTYMLIYVECSVRMRVYFYSYFVCSIIYIYYYREYSGLVANEQRSQHKLVMALCYARQEVTWQTVGSCRRGAIAEPV